MRRQHDIGMRGGHGGVKDRAQERASVCHGFTGFEMETCSALSIRFRQKKTPAEMRGVECEEGIVSRTRCSALHPGHVRERSASDVAADDVAEQLPPFALETLQLQLAD